MDNSKRGTIPMQERLNLNKSQGTQMPKEVNCMKNVPYASAVGSIMYAVRCTRLDVAFAQNLTSRFQHNPGELHWTAMKNILKYLRNTKDMFLVYGGNPSTNLELNAIAMQDSRLVDWKSSKKSTIAMSATEYIAASEATMEAVWIMKFISGFGIVPTINEPLNMYCDNSAAIHYANEPGVQKVALTTVPTLEVLPLPFVSFHCPLMLRLQLLLWNGYLRKGRKTKPKQQNRTQNGKA
ncbi:hypothetical protein Tco_0995430 [Tanacetum coccineum]